MQFGLFFINEKPPGRSDRQVFVEALEQCRLADELGVACSEARREDRPGLPAFPVGLPDEVVGSVGSIHGGVD